MKHKRFSCKLCWCSSLKFVPTQVMFYKLRYYPIHFSISLTRVFSCIQSDVAMVLACRSGLQKKTQLHTTYRFKEINSLLILKTLTVLYIICILVWVFYYLVRPSICTFPKKNLCFWKHCNCADLLGKVSLALKAFQLFYPFLICKNWG